VATNGVRNKQSLSAMTISQYAISNYQYATGNPASVHIKEFYIFVIYGGSARSQSFQTTHLKQKCSSQLVEILLNDRVTNSRGGNILEKLKNKISALKKYPPSKKVVLFTPLKGACVIPSF